MIISEFVFGVMFALLLFIYIRCTCGQQARNSQQQPRHNGYRNMCKHCHLNYQNPGYEFCSRSCGQAHNSQQQFRHNGYMGAYLGNMTSFRPCPVCGRHNSSGFTNCSWTCKEFAKNRGWRY
jgi:hypothetical protein